MIELLESAIYQDERAREVGERRGGVNISAAELIFTYIVNEDKPGSPNWMIALERRAALRERVDCLVGAWEDYDQLAFYKPYGHERAVCCVKAGKVFQRMRASMSAFERFSGAAFIDPTWEEARELTRLARAEAVRNGYLDS